MMMMKMTIQLPSNRGNTVRVALNALRGQRLADEWYWERRSTFTMDDYGCPVGNTPIDVVPPVKIQLMMGRIPNASEIYNQDIAGLWQTGAEWAYIPTNISDSEGNKPHKDDKIYRVAIDEAVKFYDYQQIGLLNKCLYNGSVVVYSEDRGTTYTEGTDYTLEYNRGAIKRISGGSIQEMATVYLSYKYDCFRITNILDYKNKQMVLKLERA